MKLLGIVLLVLLLLGGIGWYLSHRSDNQTMMDQNPVMETQNEKMMPTSEAPTETNSFTGTLSDLLARGGDKKCDWKHEVNGTSVSGTTYVSGKRFAGTGTLNTNNMNMETHTMGDGTTLYTWFKVPGMSQMTGTKMTYADMEKMGKDTQTTPEQQAQAMQSMSYDCSPWKADESMFQVPKDVNFSAAPMMPATGTMTPPQY